MNFGLNINYFQQILKEAGDLGMMKNWVWIVTDAQTEQVTGMAILGTYDKLALI